ncbi:hypothetical protein ASD19_06915 [Microbacterium sp. Root53]|nr:hypothetical protein ASD19_06915 [Microbacterium sp. Root53]
MDGVIIAAQRCRPYKPCELQQVGASRTCPQFDHLGSMEALQKVVASRRVRASSMDDHNVRAELSLPPDM